MQPLITPGNYDVGLNQDFLIKKLTLYDIYLGIFCAFWISVFLCIAVYVIIKKIKRNNFFEKEMDLIKQETNKNKQRDAIFIKFHEICRLIHEDRDVFRRPEKMIEEMYYDDLKEVMFEMLKMRTYMKAHYKHLIPDFEFYSKKFRKDEKQDEQ